MTQPDKLNVLPGMTVSVTVYPADTKKKTRILVPAKAVLAEADKQKMVWVIDPQTMRVHRRKVTTGSVTGTDSIEILSGLQGGERIATTGMNQLQEDMEIRLLKE